MASPLVKSIKAVRLSQEEVVPIKLSADDMGTVEIKTPNFSPRKFKKQPVELVRNERIFSKRSFVRPMPPSYTPWKTASSAPAPHSPTAPAAKTAAPTGHRMHDRRTADASTRGDPLDCMSAVRAEHNHHRSMYYKDKELGRLLHSARSVLKRGGFDVRMREKYFYERFEDQLAQGETPMPQRPHTSDAVLPGSNQGVFQSRSANPVRVRGSALLAWQDAREDWHGSERPHSAPAGATPKRKPARKASPSQSPRSGEAAAKAGPSQRTQSRGSPQQAGPSQRTQSRESSLQRGGSWRRRSNECSTSRPDQEGGQQKKITEAEATQKEIAALKHMQRALELWRECNDPK